jgi:hypothetical protein
MYEILWKFADWFARERTTQAQTYPWCCDDFINLHFGRQAEENRGNGILFICFENKLSQNY